MHEMLNGQFHEELICMQISILKLSNQKLLHTSDNKTIP